MGEDAAGAGWAGDCCSRPLMRGCLALQGEPTRMHVHR
jgi:hypothetical protein